MQILNPIHDHSTFFFLSFRKKMDLTISQNYVHMVLHNMCTHLNLHIANLTCAVARKDTINCDIKTFPGVCMLEEATQSFSSQLALLEEV